MENSDQTLADFMMSKATSDNNDDAGPSSGDKKKEGKDKDGKGKDKEESESDKELKEAKKNSRAKANAVAFNPELAKHNMMRLAVVYGLVGLLVIGLLIYSKRHEGWLSRGIHKTISSVLYR